VEFAANGTLYSAGGDGTVRVWSATENLVPMVSLASSAEPASKRPQERSFAEELRATDDKGYTVVAYNGQRSHLALYGPSFSTPLDEWGDDIRVEWKFVTLERTALPYGDDGSFLVTAGSSSGATYTWRYFEGLRALLRFAEQKLPFFDGRRIKLSEGELCRLNAILYRVERSRCLALRQRSIAP
jgi:hypothetical protein